MAEQMPLALRPVTLLPILLLVPSLLLATEYTRLDTWVSDLFYDPSLNGFPLKHDWVFQQLLHTGGRWMVVLIGILVLGAWIRATWRASDKRTAWGFILLAMAAATSAVAVIKAQSPVHCPYDLLQYGGEFQRVTILDSPGSGQEAGHCWPAGHASAGFSLWAFYFAALAYRPKLAPPLFWTGLVLGVLYGLVQTARGAHFLSHTAWTALLVWCTNALLALLLLRDRIASHA